MRKPKMPRSLLLEQLEGRRMFAAGPFMQSTIPFSAVRPDAYRNFAAPQAAVSHDLNRLSELQRVGPPPAESGRLGREPNSLLAESDTRFPEKQTDRFREQWCCSLQGDAHRDSAILESTVTSRNPIPSDQPAIHEVFVITVVAYEVASHLPSGDSFISHPTTNSRPTSDFESVNVSATIDGHALESSDAQANPINLPDLVFSDVIAINNLAPGNSPALSIVNRLVDSLDGTHTAFPTAATMDYGTDSQLDTIPSDSPPYFRVNNENSWSIDNQTLLQLRNIAETQLQFDTSDLDSAPDIKEFKNRDITTAAREAIRSALRSDGALIEISLAIRDSDLTSVYREHAFDTVNVVMSATMAVQNAVDSLNFVDESEANTDHRNRILEIIASELALADKPTDTANTPLYISQLGSAAVVAGVVFVTTQHRRSIFRRAKMEQTVKQTILPPPVRTHSSD